MKKQISILLILIFTFAFVADAQKRQKRVKQSKSSTQPPSQRGKFIRGSRGGCYYISSNGKKTYVDRSLCN